MRACVLLQLSGTPMHQGLLLGAVTPTNNLPAMQSMLSAPHAFMNANESTPVCIEVPFYFTVQLARTNCVDSLNGFAINSIDYAYLTVRVINVLRTAVSASTSLNVSIHFMVKEAKFYIPRNTDNTWDGQSADFYRLPTRIFDGLAQGAKILTGDIIDSARSALRTFTGFHNPNTPAINTRMINTDRNFLNNVDQPSLLEKLDTFGQHDRIYDKPYFSTKQDEMDIKHLLSKPQYVGTFAVTSNTPIGRVLFSQPITPMIEVGTSYNTMYSPMRILYEMSRYWRGTIKMHIQPVMTNFHFCKLVVVNDYTGDKRLLSSKPNFNQVHNMITSTVEFSAGGQVQTVDLPFCSQLDQLECHKDVRANALSHGVTYIYLMQPLVVNGAVPLTVDFNIYFTVGDDFQYYGYMVDPLIPRVPPLLALRTTRVDSNKDLVAKMREKVESVREEIISKRKNGEITVAEAVQRMRDNGAQNHKLHIFAESVDRVGEITQEGFKAEVGDVPVTVDIGDQDAILNSKTDDKEDLKANIFKPMINVRDYMRRMPNSELLSFTSDINNGGVIQIPIASFFSNIDALSVFSTLYYGAVGGLKIRLLTKYGLNTTVYYVPPGSVYNASDITYRPANSSNYLFTFSNYLGFPNQIRSQTVYVPPKIRAGISNTAQRGDLELTEFVIPNMNVCNFYATPALGDKYISSLGYIAVAFNVDLGVTVQFEIGVAAADEFRFGYQAISTGVDLYRDVNNLRITALGTPGLAIPLSNAGALAAYTRNAT